MSVSPKVDDIVVEDLKSPPDTRAKSPKVDDIVVGDLKSPPDTRA